MTSIVPLCLHLFEVVSALLFEVSDDTCASGSGQSVDEEQLESLPHALVTDDKRELSCYAVETVDLEVDQAASGLGNNSVKPEQGRDEREGVHDGRNE
ncbi:hypothetical protein PMAYCL1PPCAC_28024, partial [Pristionchus mayeri]